MRRAVIRWWVATALVVGVGAPVVALGQEAEDPDVDRVALAAVLISDGYWDRAARVLEEVDEADKRLDRARFFTLRGLVRLQQDLPDQAVADFEQALTEEGVDPLIHVQLARARQKVGDLQGALDALEAGGEAIAMVRGTWLLRADLHRQREEPKQAWVALVNGERRFPDDAEFSRQKVFLLVRMGLYLEALDSGRALLARDPDDQVGWLALAEALRNAGRTQEAVELLEEARLRFPSNTQIATLLARVWLQDGHPHAAGEVLRAAAEIDPSLFNAVAESFRQAGESARALYFNSRVPDPAGKAKQRLGLYISLQDWARAVALEDRIERLGLGEDDGLRYALAYAWMQLGDFDASERWLSGIADPRVFKDATKLREIIAERREVTP